MSRQRKRPLPVDPIDGTKIYMPLGRRFSPCEDLGGVRFDEPSAEDKAPPC